MEETENSIPAAETNSSKQERKAQRRQAKEKERLLAKRRQKMKRYSLWSAVFIAVIAIVGVIAWQTGPSGESNGGDNRVLGLEVSVNDHTLGQITAPIVVVEYADFQCPACASYHSMVKQLANDLNDRVRFVFRHFPLKQIHANADLASRAAEAAGQQQKFWEMGDLLYSRQNDWSNANNTPEIFADYAQELGLDTGRFKADLESGVVRDKVDSDYNSALRLGLNSTPSFFINGRKISNPRSYEQFKQEIEQSRSDRP